MGTCHNDIEFRLPVLLPAALLFAILSAVSQAATTPSPTRITDRVLVIRNANSPVSQEVADDYCRRRGVRNILTVTCPDSAMGVQAETMSFKGFQETVEAPLAAFLATRPEIDFIVLTKGMPLRLADVSQGPAPGPMALDSYLASWRYDKLPDGVRVEVTDPAYGAEFHGLAWANRFWDSSQRFSHGRVGGYLVTRLDGYTAADAKALTTRALEAEAAMQRRKSGSAPILLDMCPAYGFVTNNTHPHSLLADPSAAKVKIIRESEFGEFNSDMQWAARQLSNRGVPVQLDLAERFVGNASKLAGYVSWGSNDQKFDAQAYRSLSFSPGALAETAVSTSARTFLPTTGGQSLIADLIAQGTTGAKGYSDEPLLQAVASPSILFDRYAQGWTLAESYYAASRLVGWRDIVIGDPICRSYPER
jgi:uncharacterized protein (TIGR03790 family)